MVKIAHFAQIDSNNIVTDVLVVKDKDAHRGQEFLADDCKLGGTWIQTSYHTYSGVHRLGGTPLRKNYAGKGMSYDPALDAFIPVKCHDVATLDTDTANWICTDPTHTLIIGE